MEQITKNLQNQSISHKRPADLADLSDTNSHSGHRLKNSGEEEDNNEILAILADKRRGPHRKDRQVHRWTPEEDQLLQEAVNKHGAKNWKMVATLVPGRDHTQCLQRWSKCLAPGLRKGTWTLEEDELLTKCVQNQLQTISASDNRGKKIPWGEVSKHIKGRTAKQCRERWVNNLDPVINKGAWRKEEDELMTELFKKYGPSWAAIAKEMEGRTENGVKIRWKTLARTKEGQAAAALAPAPIFEKPQKLNKVPSKSKSVSSDEEGTDEEDYQSKSVHAPPELPRVFSTALQNSTGSTIGAGGAYYIQAPQQQGIFSPQQQQIPQYGLTQQFIPNPAFTAAQGSQFFAPGQFRQVPFNPQAFPQASQQQAQQIQFQTAPGFAVPQGQNIVNPGFVLNQNFPISDATSVGSDRSALDMLNFLGNGSVSGSSGNISLPIFSAGQKMLPRVDSGMSGWGVVPGNLAHRAPRQPDEESSSSGSSSGSSVHSVHSGQSGQSGQSAQSMGTLSFGSFASASGLSNISLNTQGLQQAFQQQAQPQLAFPQQQVYNQQYFVSPNPANPTGMFQPVVLQQPYYPQGQQFQPQPVNQSSEFLSLANATPMNRRT